MKKNITSRLIELFKKHHSYFIEYVSENYPFALEEIYKYNEILNWKSPKHGSGCLSHNYNIPWSEEFLNKNSNKIDFNIICNTIIGKQLWFDAVLEKRYIDWTSLSSNENIPWTEQMVYDYFNKFHMSSLFNNASIPWSEELIERLKDNIDWAKLSCCIYFPWTEKFIEKYKNRLDWYGLSFNSGLPWSIDFIKKYQTKINWNHLSSGFALKKHWNFELIVTFENFWNWEELFSSGNLPLTEKLTNKYLDKISVTELSRNDSIIWSEEAIDNFKTVLSWYYLSSNENLPWSISFLEKYQNFLNYNELSKNTVLPWNTELINENLYKWDWVNLSNNTRLPWSAEFIAAFEKHWDWKSISRNSFSNKNIDIIEKFEDKLDWNILNFEWKDLISQEEYKFITFDLLDYFKNIQVNNQEKSDNTIIEENISKPLYTEFIVGYPLPEIYFLNVAAEYLEINYKVEFHGCCICKATDENGNETTDAGLMYNKIKNNNEKAEIYYNKTIGTDWKKQLDKLSKFLNDKYGKKENEEDLPF